ncbi:MAG: hypothetical protein IKY33_04310 [Clostridia bacterium]|nr:hypothetical protein [Clostridia bacterium]
MKLLPQKHFDISLPPQKLLQTADREAQKYFYTAKQTEPHLWILQRKREFSLYHNSFTPLIVLHIFKDKGHLSLVPEAGMNTLFNIFFALLLALQLGLTLYMAIQKAFVLEGLIPLLLLLLLWSMAQIALRLAYRCAYKTICSVIKQFDK